jgi:hypothetical protein
MISHQAGNTVEATKAMALFRKLATRIVWRWMRDLSANAVCTYFPCGYSTSRAEDINCLRNEAKSE